MTYCAFGQVSGGLLQYHMLYPWKITISVLYTDFMLHTRFDIRQSITEREPDVLFFGGQMHVYLVCVIHTNYLLTTGWAKYFIFFFTKQYMNVALKKVSYFHRMCQWITINIWSILSLNVNACWVYTVNATLASTYHFWQWWKALNIYSRASFVWGVF